MISCWPSQALSSHAPRSPLCCHDGQRLGIVQTAINRSMRRLAEPPPQCISPFTHAGGSTSGSATRAANWDSSATSSASSCGRAAPPPPPAARCARCILHHRYRLALSHDFWCDIRRAIPQQRSSCIAPEGQLHSCCAEAMPSLSRSCPQPSHRLKRRRLGASTTPR